MRSHAHIEALCYPKSTAAGEGARATQNQLLLWGSAARLKAASLQNNFKISRGGRTWNPTFKKLRVEHLAGW